MVHEPIHGHLQGRQLVAAGLTVFIFGLLGGFFAQFLSSSLALLFHHLEIAVSGLILVFLGLQWSRLAIAEPWCSWFCRLFIYGTVAKALATVGFILWGAGRGIDLAGRTSFVNTSLLTLLAMLLAVAILLVYGLRRRATVRRADATTARERNRDATAW